MKKTVLMITYDFPPIGGGGVQRNVKFLKYLSRLGWDTHVLTVKERDFYVFDTTLLDEIKETRIHKSSSWDPVSLSFRLKNFFKENFKFTSKNSTSNDVKEDGFIVTCYRFFRKWILLPDGFGGWIPFAYRMGKKVIKEVKPDVLFCTFPVPSNAFVTYKLWKKFKIPFIVDFRDAWVDDPYTEFPSALHKRYHRYYEKKILKSAEKVIVYAEALKEILENKYGHLKGKIEVITNGYDPEDFDNLKPVQRGDTDKVRLVYSGSVYIDRRENFVFFIDAIKLLSPSLLDKIEIIFVGDKLQWADQLVNDSNLSETISFTGYLSHSDALRYLLSADASLMFLKPGDKVALTGKIFEYLAVGSPIIACVEPDGACAELLDSIDHSGGVCKPDDIKDIADKIVLLMDGKLNRLDLANKELFSRKYHSECLSHTMSYLLKD
jgi:glycosyltransferase involved in cell wall biosynthesis